AAGAAQPLQAPAWWSARPGRAMTHRARLARRGRRKRFQDMPASPWLRQNRGTLTISCWLSLLRPATDLNCLYYAPFWKHGEEKWPAESGKGAVSVRGGRKERKG